MVLVPPYIKVDELVVPLRVEPPIGDWPARSLVRVEEEYILLEGLHYAIGALIHMPAKEVLALLHDRKRVLSDQGVSVNPVGPEDGDDWGESARNWEQLTGQPPDMSDVYYAGASFTDHGIVIPRTTLIKLMTKLYEINDALRDGRMEPRIDDSIPLPPPRPPLPPPPWTDEELRALEDEAVHLDEIDPFTAEHKDQRTAKRAEDRRGYLFGMLEYAHKRMHHGEANLPMRFAHLGLTELQRYHAAFQRLSAYLEAPERIAIVEPTIEAAKREAGVTGPVTCTEITAAGGFLLTPYSADVSIDLFRLPEARRPEGVSETEWFARCEAAFVHRCITGTVARTDDAGDLFTRILGHQVRMRYRPEMSSVLQLWRVELM